MARGTQYEVQVWVKVLRNGMAVSGDDANNCSRARLLVRTGYDNNVDRASYLEQRFNVASLLCPFADNGWNVLQGIFTGDGRVADGDSIALLVERQRQV